MGCRMILNLRHAYYRAEADGMGAVLEMKEVDMGMRAMDVGMREMDIEEMLPAIEDVGAARLNGGRLEIIPE
jgi:hypothetical protein